MNKKAYIQPHTKIVNEIISDALLTASTFKGEVDWENESTEAPEARHSFSVWDDEEEL